MLQKKTRTKPGLSRNLLIVSLLNIWILYWNVQESSFTLIKKQLKQATATCAHIYRKQVNGIMWWVLLMMTASLVAATFAKNNFVGLMWQFGTYVFSHIIHTCTWLTYIALPKITIFFNCHRMKFTSEVSILKAEILLQWLFSQKRGKSGVTFFGRSRDRRAIKSDHVKVGAWLRPHVLVIAHASQDWRLKLCFKHTIGLEPGFMSLGSLKSTQTTGNILKLLTSRTLVCTHSHTTLRPPFDLCAQTAVVNPQRN